MSIPVTCPSCGHQTKAPDTAAGKRGKCPKCGGVVQVPSDAAPPVIDAEVVEAQVVDSPPPLPDTIPIEPAPGDDAGAPPQDRRPCPVCGEMIPTNALKCRFCNEIFDPELKKQEAKKGKSSFIGGEGENLSAGEWVVALLCSGIGCIVGIVWMVQGKPKGKKMLLISLGMQVFWVIVRLVIEAAAASAR
jgi:hypothetical protein